METADKLRQVLKDYGVPDPKIVGKLPKGGTTLDFVGHADVTKMLIEIDPMWTWEPVAFDADGLPAYRVENGMAHMAGWLTIHGVRRLGIGSVAHNKADLLKELCSDFIRNAAMRHGVCLSLWTKQEWDDVSPTVNTAPAPKRTAKAADTIQRVAEKAAVKEANTKLSDAQIEQFLAACETKGVDPVAVSANAGVSIEEATEADLGKLRAAFKELASFKEGE